jgi:hypothetical protein
MKLKKEEKIFRKKLGRYLTKSELWEISNYLYNNLFLTTLGVGLSASICMSDEDRLRNIYKKINKLLRRLRRLK